MAQEVVTSLVGNVVDKLFGKAKEEIGYMWNWSKNVKDLEKENKNLTLMRERVLELIKAAEEKGDRLLPGVEDWVVNAESHINEAKEIIKGAKAHSHISEAKAVTGGANAEVTERANTESHVPEDIEVTEGTNVDGVEGIANKTCCNLGMCVNPGTCYTYGKKAANMAPLLKTVQEDGKTFESCVSVPTRPPGILDLYEQKNIDDFKTHKSCFNRIMDSIKDDTKQIVGIYGIGGVGKTTLAKEVAVSPTVKSSFDAVEFITVSQPVDAERIKKEAENAAKRIINGNKILVILDDVWEELKLDEVGIPCGTRFKNCKILLTSRSEDVCESMNAACLISVATLPTKEAWMLFKRVVGDTVETDKKLKTIAKKIVEGCGGLPLIIQVVGATLKNESIESWKQALRQLQKRKMPNIDPKVRLAYSHLQLSYGFLKSEEAKSCFLLCSMFPEDYDIPLESLAYYGAGRKIFKDLDSMMEDARDRVRSAVKILKYTCLLLDGRNKLTVKMHDVVREVALLIASEGGNKFLVKAGVGLEEWEPPITDTVKSCIGISLMHNRIEQLPDYKLEIPLLDIFLIQGNRLSTIPDEFILGVKEARVIDLGRNKIVSLPESVKQLTKLCVLNLGENKNLCDISILGDLTLLEILILSYTKIAEIPQEIGNLVNLRRLEVKGCKGLSHIAPSVMSKLRWLEELHIDYYGVEDGNNEGLMEIEKLSMLTFLDLFVSHAHLIPKGVCFTKLKGFVIQIGGLLKMYNDGNVVHRKTLILGMKVLDTPSMLQAKELIELSDGIIFDKVDNPNNLVPTMYCESLDDLTTILLYQCHNLLSLVDSSVRNVDEELGGENSKKQFFSKLEHLILLDLEDLQVLWKCPDEYISLKNLLTLEIAFCNNIVRLFSINVARGLVNLQYLMIYECDNLKEVIWDVDGGDNEMVVFQRLVKIDLCNLRKLKRFNGGEVEISYPALEKVVIHGELVTVDEWEIIGKTTLVNYLEKENIGIVYTGLEAHVQQVLGLREWPVLK